MNEMISHCGQDGHALLRERIEAPLLARIHQLECDTQEVAAARSFLRDQNRLLARISELESALADCSLTLNQFDPFDDLQSLWQLKADIDIDRVINKARAALVKEQP